MIEWEKVSGVTRQRQGQMGTYEGKATSQQSIVQSSHITEDLFRKFSQFEQKELQGMIDYSKVAWINGKKSMYVLPDGSIDDIDVEPLTHMESEYGIFVSDAGKDVERMQKIEGLTQAALQNGTPLSSIISIFESNSFAQIKDKVLQAEKANQELVKAQQQAEQEAKAQEIQMQQQNLQMQLVEKEKDRQMQIEKALIAAESSFNGNSASLEKMLQDFQIKQEELALKERELEIKAQQANKE
jgi:hypothetical protein